jgi:hypothetical protein
MSDFKVHVLAAAKKPRKTKPKTQPVIVVAKADPKAVKLAHKLAGPDQRVEVQRDGSIVIKNGRK